MNGAGEAIKDIEFVPENESIFSVPEGAKQYAVRGLGGAGKLSIRKAEAGAITTTLATGSSTGVGFQPHNFVQQIGPTSFISRGSTFSCARINPGIQRKVGRTAFTARRVLGGQPSIEVKMPTRIETLLVIFTGSEQPEDVVLSGWKHDETPSVAIHGDQQYWLWSMEGESSGLEVGSIRIDTGEECQVHSVVGLQGKTAHVTVVVS